MKKIDSKFQTQQDLIEELCKNLLALTIELFGFRRCSYLYRQFSFVQAFSKHWNKCKMTVRAKHRILDDNIFDHFIKITKVLGLRYHKNDVLKEICVVDLIN